LAIHSFISDGTCSKKNNCLLRASMSVEAAMVVPLFIFVVINLLFGIQVIETSSRISAAIHETGNEICSYGYAIENSCGEGIPLNIAEIIYVSSKVSHFLEDSIGNRNGIKGGISGISYIGSEILNENNIVKIVVSYSIRLPVDMNIKTYRLGDVYYGHAWTGYDGNIANVNENLEDPIVYITNSGTVYHRDIHCSHLNPSVKAINGDDIGDKRSKDGSKYYECEICGKGIKTGTVYITDYGNRYHTDTNCSGIKRNVLTVHLSEIGGRRECATCGG